MHITKRLLTKKNNDRIICLQIYCVKETKKLKIELGKLVLLIAMVGWTIGSGHGEVTLTQNSSLPLTAYTRIEFEGGTDTK